MKILNKYGDSTPPCLTPAFNSENCEKTEPHLTHDKHIANEFSKMLSTWTGISLSINFINKAE